ILSRLSPIPPGVPSVQNAAGMAFLSPQSSVLCNCKEAWDPSIYCSITLSLCYVPFFPAEPFYRPGPHEAAADPFKGSPFRANTRCRVRQQPGSRAKSAAILRDLRPSGLLVRPDTVGWLRQGQCVG